MLTILSGLVLLTGMSGFFLGQKKSSGMSIQKPDNQTETYSTKSCIYINTTPNLDSIFTESKKDSKAFEISSSSVDAQNYHLNVTVQVNTACGTPEFSAHSDMKWQAETGSISSIKVLLRKEKNQDCQKTKIETKDICIDIISLYSDKTYSIDLFPAHDSSISLPHTVEIQQSDEDHSGEGDSNEDSHDGKEEAESDSE